MINIRQTYYTKPLNMIPMAFLTFIAYQTLFIGGGAILYNLLRRRSEFADLSQDLNMKKVFLFGFIGWILAFLRIILINAYQILLLMNAGIDINDPSAIANSPLIYSYQYVLIGPLLSGLFEETVRFWLIKKVFPPSQTKIDRKFIPLIFGYSWAYSEILVLTLPTLLSPNLSFANFALSLLERIFAVMVHICFTYLVLYGMHLKKSKTVGLSILIHTIFNTILVVLGVELGMSLGAIAISETVMFLMTSIIIIFTIRYRKVHEAQILIQSTVNTPELITTIDS